MDSATIVSAALDSRQLEDSINKLVQTVASKTKEMADNFTSEVRRMENAVKNLGNIKIDSGGTADGGSSRRTSSLKQEEQQVKSVATSYDGLAKAQQTAIGSRGGSALRKDIDEAALSYTNLIQQIQRTQSKFDVSPIQNLRMRQHELEAGMQTAANEAAKAKKDVDELNAAISNYRKTLETLPKNQQGFANRQAIQKEINDLITLRDASVSEQQKWTNAGRVLAAQYESVKGEIKQIGQALIDSEKSEKQVTSELDKQLQKIKEINSSKSAKAAYESISSMPTNTIDQVEVKLQALQALKEKVANTPLLSKSSQSQLTQAITDTKGRIEQIEMAARGTNQSKKSLDELNAAIIQNIRREEERRNAILQTGIAAQEAFAKIRQSAQIQLADNTDKPIMGVKELTEAIRNMRQAYYGMNASEKESPLGQSLQRDIENAQKLRTAIDAYNKTLLGLPVIQDKSGIDKTLGSYTELSALLKTLSDEYRHLGREERNAAKGNDLADKIQRLGRETQKAQQQMNRPINLDAALKGSEKTIDDITYKIQRLQSYKVGIDLTKPNAANEIKQVDEAILRLQKDLDKYLGKSKDILASNNALGRSWNYMKNRLAFYVTVGAGTQFIKNLIEVRSQYEMNEKALGILLDSASRGTRIFNELSQMSLVSPYTLIELSSAAKQLTAYDIAAKDVVDTTRRLADMASAVGVPVERLTYALGQIKAYGYLNSRDARMFANAGIPLVKQLADYYSELEGKMVSTADVYDRMKKKAIDYADVMKVVTKMTDEGGKFFDFQAKMADTLKVRLANLTLAWNNMLNELGKSNQGTLTTGIKSLTVIFRHWREIYRILSTLIVALGAYKVATILAGMTTKSAIGSSAVASWLSLARGVKSAKDAVALFSLTLKSIPFTGWVTAIATLASYFYLFNNSTDGLKQKLEDIATAFDGVRKEITDLYADALKSDNIGSQLTKLRDMLELAQTEMGVTIPINLEDVNESNIKQKLKEAKRFIDDYINFSQTFSEAAAGTKFNELMNDFGSKARSTYTSISESINTVVVALQELVDKGNANKRDIEILNELTSGQKEDESRIEYLQRLVHLYEELGLVGKKVTTPSISIFSSSKNNMDELTEQQNMQLDRLGVKNRQVFENMLKDVQNYYSSSAIAQYQFEQQVERVAKKIDINNIPVEQRTVKLSAAINEEASQNNWNQFEKEFARQIANKKFGTNIVISEESKGVAETELQEWQKRQQAWMDKNGINVKLNFQTNDTEASYASRMLQAAKDAQEEVAVQQRKLKIGTGTQEALDAATAAAKTAREEARAAGADLSSLDKKTTATAKKAESELARALKDELSVIEKVRSIYKELTKEGASHADAIKSATEGWEESVNAINRILTKNGLKGLNLNDFVGIENPREILKTLQAQLDEMVKRGAKPSEIQVLQEKIKTVKVDAEKYDLTKITKGLNNELDRLKDEYELAVSLDADPELGNIFAEMFDINVDELPHSINEYAERVTNELNDAIKKRKDKIQLPTITGLTKDDIKEFREMSESGGLNIKSFEEIEKAFTQFRELRQKAASDVAKIANDYIREYGDISAQIELIEKEKNNNLTKLNDVYNTEALRKTKDYTDAKAAIVEGAARKEAKATFDALKKSTDYERFFTAIDTLTKKDALKIKNKIKAGIIDAFKNGGLTFSQFRKEIKNLEEQFDKLIEPTQGWVSYLNGGFDALIQKAKNTGQEIESIGEQISITGKVDEKDKNFLQSFGKIFSGGGEKGLDFTSLIEKFGGNIEGLGNAVSQAGQGMQGAAGSFASAISIVDMIIKGVHQTVQAIASVIDELNSVRSEDNKIGNAYWEGFKKFDNYAFSGWENLKSGNVAGAIGDTANSIISIFNAFSNAKNEKINKQLKESARTVKDLENAYKDLEVAVNKSLGDAETGARRVAIENKKLQLAELERQLQLEESRSSKRRDEDRIKELQGAIIDARNEIQNMTEDVVNSLTGEDVKNAAEEFVDAWVEAWKAGETTLDSIQEKMDDIIENIIKKAVASKIVGNLLKPFYDAVDSMTSETSEGGVSLTTNELRQLAQQAGVKVEEINTALGELYGELSNIGIISPTEKSMELSALQQGLQGVSEETAGAVEAYLNGMSQQAYLRNDLLTQIRDTIMSFDVDVQLGVFSQMLLQLQNNYIVMQSMQSMMEGWTTPSGQGIRVELIS